MGLKQRKLPKLRMSIDKETGLVYFGKPTMFLMPDEVDELVEIVARRENELRSKPVNRIEIS